MAQPLGDPEPGLVFGITMPQKGFVPLRCTGVAQSVEGQRAVGIRVADLLAVAGNKVLQFRNGDMDLLSLRDKQLLTCRGMLQSAFQRLLYSFAKWNLPHLAAFSFNCEQAGFQDVSGSRRVDPHALVDSQASIPGHFQAAEIVKMLGFLADLYEFLKLALTPSAVYFSKRAAFQIILLVPRQAVPSVGNLVMPEADRRQVGFDGAGC